MVVCAYLAEHHENTSGVGGSPEMGRANSRSCSQFADSHIKYQTEATNHAYQ